MNRKVYVTNLAPEAGEPELKSLFSKARNDMSVRIVKDGLTTRSWHPPEYSLEIFLPIGRLLLRRRTIEQ